MKKNIKHFMVIINLITMLLIIVPKVSARDLGETQPIVHAVFFYSTSCGHCEKVITQDLPPLIEKYGNQLQIIGINVATVE